MNAALLNEKTITAAREGSAAFRGDAVRRWVETLPALVAGMIREAAIGTREARDDLVADTNRLGSSASGMGAERLAHACATLEREARAGAAIARLRALVRDVMCEAAAARFALERLLDSDEAGAPAT